MKKHCECFEVGENNKAYEINNTRGMEVKRIKNRTFLGQI